MKNKLTNLEVFDTMSRSLKPVPQDDPVTIYTCGPTVYSDPHIGNWRAFIFYDTLVRALKVNGYSVERTMNLTDVGHLVGDGDDGEDKLQKAANKQRKTAWDIAAVHIKAFAHGMKDLNMVQPDHVVRATDMIDEQIMMVEALENKGFAYKINDGIYFDTSKLKDYGKLAKLNIEEQQAGARVAVNERKRNPSDFALWKFSPKDKQRDMEWESPWGVGFPGWHLECSVIAEQTLGKTLTIHTGGVDHIPVHHTNEIAQSEAANDQELSKIWIHNEHILVEGQKMSKSLENDYTLKDLEQKDFSPLDFRTLVLMAKYRTQQNFTWDSLDDARKLRHDLRVLGARLHQPLNASNSSAEKVNNAIQETRELILKAITHDLNTPEVLNSMGALKDQLDTAAVNADQLMKLQNLLELFDAITGLDISEVEDISQDDYELILQRQTLRAKNDFVSADKIRDELKLKNIEINDTDFGSIWYYSV